MKNPYKFIEEKLKMLFERFPKANIRYEHRESTNTHVVEITPLFFYNNDSYRVIETEIEDEFEVLFPAETIIFISEDSLNKISNPNIEHLGERKGKVCIIQTTHIQFFNFTNISPKYFGENNYALAA
ncbi:hypothetical protein [Flavobacterium capsici]|uniref:Uncharacterized protein n=1 Tax=Flavobacterium capsici TaxID=3075618 RepID=A0AA96J8L0_9FLAO|nr:MULTISPECIES: hypothetical protein [unclassified Flavobacterium]WNM19484.1 hypothetical protein RN608_02095 [Flavobacterium sp. PMR2A8]WNM20873.1 hypothetical protein RN605_09265 [Flavobacterium sp. PMTSA4]